MENWITKSYGMYRMVCPLVWVTDGQEVMQKELQAHLSAVSKCKNTSCFNSWLSPGSGLPIPVLPVGDFQLCPGCPLHFRCGRRAQPCQTLESLWSLCVRSCVCCSGGERGNKDTPGSLLPWQSSECCWLHWPNRAMRFLLFFSLSRAFPASFVLEFCFWQEWRHLLVVTKMILSKLITNVICNIGQTQAGILPKCLY